MSVDEHPRIDVQADEACPICWSVIDDETACAVCGWQLSTGWVLGPVTAAAEEAFRGRMETAQRRFDLTAAARAAGFPDAGERELLGRLEAVVRGGPPEGAERNDVITAVRAESSPDAPGPATARDFARRAAERHGAGDVLVVEIGAEGIAVSVFEVAGPGSVRQRIGDDAWTWTALLPRLSDDDAERRLQLAGGIGRGSATPAQLSSDIECALPEIAADGAHVVLVCRVPGWSVPERALELLAARIPGADRAWRRLAAEEPADETVPALIRMPAAITAFATAGDEWAATGSSDGTVTLWAPPSSKPFASRRVHGGRVTALAVAPDGTAVVTGGRDGAVRLWSPAIDHERLLAQHDEWVNAVCLAAGHAFSLADDRRVRCTPAATQEHPSVGGFPIDVGWSAASALAVSRDGRSLVVAGTDGRVVVFDGSTGTEVRTVPVGVAVTALALDPDDSRLAVGCQDGRVLVMRFPGGQRLAELRAGRAPVRAVALAPRGCALAGDDEGAVRAWSPDKLAGEGRLIGEHEKAVRGLGAGAGGRVVSGGADGTIGIWELEAR